MQGQLPIVVVEEMEQSRHTAAGVWHLLTYAGSCATCFARLSGQWLIAIVEAMEQSTHDATLFGA